MTNFPLLLIISLPKAAFLMSVIWCRQVSTFAFFVLFVFLTFCLLDFLIIALPKAACLVGDLMAAGVHICLTNRLFLPRKISLSSPLLTSARFTSWTDLRGFPTFINAVRDDCHGLNFKWVARRSCSGDIYSVNSASQSSLGKPSGKKGRQLYLF